MNSVDALSRYLDLTARRLSRYTWLRGAAILTAAALILTIVPAWVMTYVPPSPAFLWWGRIAMFAGIATVAVCAIALPLSRLNTTAVTRTLERRFPAFAQRLTTFIDRLHPDTPDPFLPLLADSALEIIRSSESERLVPVRRLAILAAGGIGAGLILTFLIAAEPGAIGRNAGALWTGKDIFRIELNASRKTIRRGGDLTVTARVNGFTAHNANLWVRDAESKTWRATPMLASTDNAFFAIQFPGVARNVEFYAESQGFRSPMSRVRVVDLPVVTAISVTYPDHPALAHSVNGDIVAPAGTIASLEIHTDRPMDGAQLTLELADPISLPSTIENLTSASLRVLRDDGYHVSMKYEGEDVPVSGEHAIEVMTSADKTRVSGTPLLNGARVGAVPRGYEKSVSEYYRRLSDQLNARR